MALTLDIANELYPLAATETFALVVARSLVPEELEVDADGDAMNGDGEGNTPRRVKRELWRSGDQGLAADYEYVMHGKVIFSPPPPLAASGSSVELIIKDFRRYINLMTRHKGMRRRTLLIWTVRAHRRGTGGADCQRRTAYFSFGGLLMALRGSYRHLANVVVGENVYLLMRK